MLHGPLLRFHEPEDFLELPSQYRWTDWKDTGRSGTPRDLILESLVLEYLEAGTPSTVEWTTHGEQRPSETTMRFLLDEDIPLGWPTCAVDFLDRALALEAMGFSDTALDLIYDTCDELMKSRQFALCASLLGEVDVSGCSIDIMLGLLTATLPAKNALSTRRAFYNRVEDELRRRGELEHELLQGLE